MPEVHPIPENQPPRPPAPLFRWSVVYPLLGLVAIAVLLSVIVPDFGTHPPNRRSATIADLSNLRTALDLFHSDTGRYPTIAEGLAALVTQPPGLAGWQGPYIEQVCPDQWGTPYRYVCPATNPKKPFDLSSAGKDRTFGTPDDLTSESAP
jgi:general secretion pathway protein G